MPIERTHTSEDSLWGWWKIAEDEETIAALVPERSISPTITNPLKRLEYLAGRALVATLLKSWSATYEGIRKDEFGKPYLSNSSYHISLTHSYPYVAAIVHRKHNVGIDLEQPKEKLLRIAPRVLSPKELEDAGNDVIKHCIYWCAKEALIKIYGKKDLILARNLHIEAFQRQPSGQLIGRIVANNSETTIPLAYIVTDNFVVVVSD
jgi:phosphopantetheinyl transferase